MKSHFLKKLSTKCVCVCVFFAQWLTLLSFGCIRRGRVNNCLSLSVSLSNTHTHTQTHTYSLSPSPSLDLDFIDCLSFLQNSNLLPQVTEQQLGISRVRAQSSNSFSCNFKPEPAPTSSVDTSELEQEDPGSSHSNGCYCPVMRLLYFV